jgi:hypothetical protein
LEGLDVQHCQLLVAYEANNQYFCRLCMSATMGGGAEIIEQLAVI